MFRFPVTVPYDTVLVAPDRDSAAQAAWLKAVSYLATFHCLGGILQQIVEFYDQQKF